MVLAVLATVGSVWWVPRSPWLRIAAVPFCVLVVLWAAYFAFRRVWMLSVVLVAVVAGYLLFGLYQSTLGSPSFEPVFTAGPVALEEIADISRFRACTVGDLSGRALDGEVERDRFMAHRVVVGSSFGSGRQVEVLAMADGVITAAQNFQEPVDLAPGSGFTYLGNFASEVELTVYRPGPFGQWIVRYQHVFPTVSAGDRVKAGDVIGYVPPSDWVNVVTAGGTDDDLSTKPIVFDVMLTWKGFVPVTGEHLASFVPYLSPDLQKAWFDKGFDPTTLVVTREERDLAPCNGQYGLNDYVNNAQITQ